ncbi:MAG: sugar ABC transporter permease [Epulopiscium sp. Nele67-Bin004]|nr:MAG: sugar ABC transporter permease [Epulopiscium sp. Nele67-Bin004]
MENIKKYNTQGFDDKLFSFFIHFFAILTIMFTSYPLIYALSASLSDPQALVSGEMWLYPIGFNFDAYEAVFKSSEIFTGYKNSIIYAVVGTSINVFMTTLAAYPLSRPDLYGKNAFTFLITFTMFFSGGMIPTYLTIDSLGLINTMGAMVLPGAISVTNMLIMRNYFTTSISEELIEAAYVDGCTNIQTLVQIVLPLSKSIIAVMVIFYFVGHWNSYFSALIYLRDDNKYPLQIFLRRILIQNESGDLYGGGGSMDGATFSLLYETLKYAVIIVSSIPVLILYPFIQKYFQKGIMIGSVKG